MLVSGANRKKRPQSDLYENSCKFPHRNRNGRHHIFVGLHDSRRWSAAVTRKALQARSEQALVVIILSTGALIAYFGLALSRM